MLVMFVEGVVVGCVLTILFLYLPMRTWARLSAQSKADIERVMGGVRRQVDIALTDGVGALLQAKAAYQPIYPGNSGRSDDPDPSWLAWLAEADLDYRQRPPSRRRPRLRGQLLLLILVLCWSLRPRRYSRWQKAADWVWEQTHPAVHRIQLWFMGFYIPAPAPPRFLAVKRRYPC